MTMTETRCELTDLYTSQCAHCLGHVAETTLERPRRYVSDVDNPPTTAAIFDSRCPQCNGPISPGDTITLVDGFWLCDGCTP